MFTVILPDSRLAGSLEDCRLLFEPCLQGGELAFCPWGAENQTEDAFLSALSSITAGKGRWQALILTDSACASRENPFDFEAAGLASGPAQSALIRLTHLLAQKPREETGSFFSDSPLAPKDRPAHLLLCSTRYLPDYAREQKLEEQLSRMAALRTPSQFWRRNGYAWQSRFLVCDVEYRRGRIPPGALFRFWLTVLAIARGEEEQRDLRAFCLYRASVRLDEPLLVRTLSRKCAEFSYLHKALLMRQAALKQKTPAGELPVLSVPIQLIREEIPPEKLSVDPTGMGTFSDSRTGGRDFWTPASGQVLQSLRRAEEIPRAALEDAALQLHSRANPDPGQPLVLDERQRRELLEQTLFHEEEQSRACASTQIRTSRLLDEVSVRREEVRKLAGGRMSRGTAAAALLTAVLCLLLGMLPAAVSTVRAGEGKLLLLLTFLGGALVIALAGAAGILWLRRPIRAAIRRFNASSASAFAAIEEKKQQIARCLTETCAAARGWSFLNRLGRPTAAEEEADRMFRRHLYFLRQTAALYADWALYFGDSVEAHLEPVPFVPFAPEIPPEQNPAYWLPTPYRFLAGLQFCPEEVIEDAHDRLDPAAADPAARGGLPAAPDR